MGLLGHSDADVLSHAVMDALLGAACMGDIGVLFPSSDPTYKGVSSLELLKHVYERVSAEYNIVNIDSVVTAQEPVLRPYIPMMAENISRVLCIPVSCVSVKATTEERMGFTGRLEGIHAQAICLLMEKTNA
jgi:2-C-methyl-D-erythritol 2,4-cyclodiphosphate synthase